MNIQNVSGQVKPYQIKQFLKLVEKYNLQAKEDVKSRYLAPGIKFNILKANLTKGRDAKLKGLRS